MTGSIHQLNRQHSSTVGKTEIIYRPKLRRCSSADDHNSTELYPIINQQKEKLTLKRSSPTSDIDSGTEEIEQQFEQIFISTSIENDEGYSECEREEDFQLSQIKEDLDKAKRIPDEMKKEFCPDTRYAFHGEFARNISIPLSLYHDLRYYLLAQDEIDPIFHENIHFDYHKLDNAKAQFKCLNPSCGHAWTSMRARILFSIAAPHIGYIVLKILGQNCQMCGCHADALWYIDEVCRVMKNLTQTIFELYFPDMLTKVDLNTSQSIEENIKSIRHHNHDPTQRKGKMFSPHRREFCEACQLGLCFASNTFQSNY